MWTKHMYLCFLRDKMDSKEKKKKKTGSRLTKQSIIEIEKDGETKFHKAQFKNDLQEIKDTDWSHIDLLKMLAKLQEKSKDEKQANIIHASGLFTTSVMPFTVKFPELIEMAKHVDFQRTIFKKDDNQIMEFSP